MLQTMLVIIVVPINKINFYEITSSKKFYMNILK